MNSVIYYLPIKQKFLKSWEYYHVDKIMLEKSYDKVFLCSGFLSFLKNLFKANHVYAWWWHRSILIILLCRLLNKKIFVTGAIHLNDMTNDKLFQKKNILYNLCLFLGLKFANKSLFISNHQYEVIKNFYNFNNFEILRSSLDFQTSFDLKNTIIKKKKYLKNNQNKPIKFSTIIWHLESQYKRKGIYETLFAFEKLFTDNPNLKFQYTIAGKNGPDVNSLINFIHKLKIKDMVVIKVDLSNKEKNDLMFLSDFYIQPSFYEGFGNAVLEAMSNGSIPIVSNLTAQPEVVGLSGIIVKSLTDVEIFNALKDITSINLTDKFKYLDLIEKQINDNFTFDIRCKNFNKIKYQI